MWSMRGYTLTYLDTDGLLTQGTIISASAVSHCGETTRTCPSTHTIPPTPHPTQNNNKNFTSHPTVCFQHVMKNRTKSVVPFGRSVCGCFVCVCKRPERVLNPTETEYSGINVLNLEPGFKVSRFYLAFGPRGARKRSYIRTRHSLWMTSCTCNSSSITRPFQSPV